jgi:GTPase SAR1 family protein
MSNIDNLYNLLEDYQAVKYRMNNEGMEYCFKHYSSFSEIEDDEFHKLRTEYISASNAIIKYVDDKIDRIESEIDNIDDEE